MVSNPIARAWFTGLWQRLLRRLGVLGLAGALLLAVAAILLAANGRLERSAKEAQAAVESQKKKLAGLKPSAVAPVAEGQGAERFADAFPLVAQSASDLRVIFECAERARVALPRGDYAVKVEGNSPFITYTATFPVHEPYARVKALAAAVLEALPHAALEEMRMARSDSMGAELDATVRFTLVYRRR